MRLDTVPLQRFADAAEHMTAECGWIDMLLADHVRQLRTEGRFNDDPMRGLYARADDVLRDLERAPRSVPAYDRLRAVIDARAALAPPPLFRIAEACGLDAFARNALALVAAPAIDRRYRTAFAFAQNDMSRAWPTPDLLVELLAPDARMARLAHFATSAPLIALGLVGFADGEEARPLADRALVVDDRVVQALLGLSCGPDARVADWIAEASVPDRLLELPPLTAAPEDALVLIECTGDAGQGIRTARWSRDCGKELLIVAAEPALSGELPVAKLAMLLAREALLRGASLMIDAMAGPGPPGRLEALLTILSHLVPPVVAAVRPGTIDGARLPYERRIHRIALAPPDAAERRQWWGNVIGEGDPADHLAWSTRLGADAIAALGRYPAEIRAAAAARCRRSLPSILRRVEPRWRREELILPAPILRQLDELTAFVAHWPQVIGQWGFAASHPQARACIALFAGPSGTGKTMAAGIVAAAAGIDLYRVNLAAVFDKYIGETEKQLDRLFDAAADAGVGVLCDEADVLFGARTEMRDAHDRYANLCTAHILQRIEDHEGLVILSTNLPKNMDDAFARRLTHSIAFPFPDPGQRARLWRAAFPPAAALDADIAWDEIAGTFELSGGNIRNAALASAYLAAANGTPIGMPHILRAVARELEKTGRAPIAADFGRLALPG